MSMFMLDVVVLLLWFVSISSPLTLSLLFGIITACWPSSGEFYLSNIFKSLFIVVPCQLCMVNKEWAALDKKWYPFFSRVSVLSKYHDSDQGIV